MDLIHQLLNLVVTGADTKFYQLLPPSTIFVCSVITATVMTEQTKFRCGIVKTLHQNVRGAAK
jgi:hypothetical protein